MIMMKEIRHVLMADVYIREKNVWNIHNKNVLFDIGPGLIELSAVYSGPALCQYSLCAQIDENTS